MALTSEEYWAQDPPEDVFDAVMAIARETGGVTTLSLQARLPYSETRLRAALAKGVTAGCLVRGRQRKQGFGGGQPAMLYRYIKDLPVKPVVDWQIPPPGVPASVWDLA